MKRYLIISVVLIIFVLLSIVLGHSIFTYINHVPKITEISNSDIANGINVDTENLYFYNATNEQN